MFVPTAVITGIAKAILKIRDDSANSFTRFHYFNIPETLVVYLNLDGQIYTALIYAN